MSGFLKFWISLIFFVIISFVDTSTRTKLIDLTHSFTNILHRHINLGLGVPTSITPYDKLSTQPMFTVTTSWGSPFLLVERPSNHVSKSESYPINLKYDAYCRAEDDRFGDSRNKKDTDHSPQQVALYFCDIEDAMSLRDEFLQSNGMQNLDMRITATSLAHALRHTSCYGNGYISGRPIDDCTGVLFSPAEGGSTRFKIVPSKRELYYASRCRGKENVGLRGDINGDLMTMTMPIIGASLSECRKRAITLKIKQRKNNNISKNCRFTKPSEKEDALMDGYIGIPVFRCKGIYKKGVQVGIRANNSIENSALIPIFFSYEDAIDTWKYVHSKYTASKGSKFLSVMPSHPDISVYNLLDLITSIDRRRWMESQKNIYFLSNFRKKLAKLLRFGKTYLNNEHSILKSKNDLFNRITFIPNRMSLESKNIISVLGNGKARLHPMKEWGINIM